MAHQNISPIARLGFFISWGFGESDMSGRPEPIVLEETYNAPTSVVWQAITDKDHMRRWFFEPMPDFRSQVGFETEFTVSFDGQDYIHQWKVTGVEPGRMIAYDWRYGGYPGHALVTWELAAVQGGTLLRLTFEWIELFPQDNPAFTRESCQVGWDYFLRQSLKGYLAGAK
jgi:uncharacterized protein YndB with AHSA1/START domain